MSTLESANTSVNPGELTSVTGNSQRHTADDLREDGYMHSPAGVSKGQLETDDTLEPIAIVGISLEFPQDAKSTESFWQTMINGKSARTEVPPERFNVNGFYHPTTKVDTQMRAKGGHFIQDDVAAFDAPFFSITPNEASCMDPVQRWLLETTYKALEGAGIPLEKANGSKTSVFVGALPGDYPVMMSRDTQQDRRYRATGTSHSILANRLSWFYKFTGPSMTIDTACSSSLVAIDLACQSLRRGSSTMALVGGCNLWMDPELSTALSELNFLSPDSTCYSFDHRANGYARGEGVGVLVLKPLSRAVAEGDTIRAVIRATGTNHNGRTPGLTQPSYEAQKKLILETYRAGGLDLRTTMFVEAHGTGTSLGDPLEAAAIGSAFQDDERLQPLIVGAVKTNIGHLEGASGIAGVIKAVLILEKAIIPPNIWFERVNPQIDMEKLNIKFPMEPTVWPTNGLRRASVNSSGFGGSNAHVVLDDAYNYLKLRNLDGSHNTLMELPPGEYLTAVNGHCDNAIGEKDHGEASACNKRPRLLVWSAAEADGLTRLHTAYLMHFKALSPNSPYESEHSYLSDLAWTLSQKRSRLPWKSFALADSISELQHVLAKATPNGFRSNHDLKLGFVFTGQGAQWPGMGRELLEYPVFRRSLYSADIFLQGLGCSWSLLSELLREEPHSRLADAAYAQPICTALQIALVDLLQTWGVTPTVVIGHSSGEIAAGYCVGGLSRESAWKIAYYRGVATSTLIESSKDTGSMLSAGLSEADIGPYLDRINAMGDELTVACINSPQNVTVSGSINGLVSLQQRLEQDEVFNKRLNVSVAYHSKQMNEIAPLYRSLMKDICGRTLLHNAPIMFSSVTGSSVLAKHLGNSDYWVANLVSPVRFLQALTNLSAKEVSEKADRGSNKGLRLNHIVEIGPHSALKGPVREYIKSTSQSSELTYDSLLIRGQPAHVTTMTALGTLYCLGQSLDIAAVNNLGESSTPRQMLLNLPSYPFNHSKKYWSEGRISRSFRSRAVKYNEFIGTPISDWNPLNARWQNTIRISENSWVQDHKVSGVIVYPAAGMLTMAIEAAGQLLSATSGARAYLFKQVIIHRALMVPLGDEGVETQLQLRPSSQLQGRFASWIEFRLYAFEKDAWSEICQGYIAIRYEKVSDSESQQVREAYQQGADRCSVESPAGSLYRFLHDHGIGFGPKFRVLKNIRVNKLGESTATSNILAPLAGAVSVDVASLVIHPVALDSVLQTGLSALSQGGRKPIATMVPTAIPSLRLFVKDGNIGACHSSSTHAPGDVEIHAKTKSRGLRNSELSFTAVHSESGQPLLTATIEATSASDIQRGPQYQDSDGCRCFYMDWKPDVDLLDADSVSSYCSSRAREPLLTSNQMLEEKELICRVGLQKLSDAKFSDNQMESKPHLRKYLSWMEHKLSQISREKDAGCVRELRDLINDESSLIQLYEKVEHCDIEGKLVVRVARDLLKTIAGEVDVLELLFQDNLLSDYYGDMHRRSEAYSNIDPYIDLLAHKRPDLKIIEIGAGTGGATQQLLDLLTYNVATESFNLRFAQYVFTDISAEFFEKARTKYRKLENWMSFACLNIESDPTEQGFEEGLYDMVVASNVQGLTRDQRPQFHSSKYKKAAQAVSQIQVIQRACLQNHRGGKLVLVEATVPDQLLSGFIFGLLPGWWLGQEEYRKWGALVTRECWHARLSDCGFSGIDLVLPSQEKVTDLSVMVSTAVDPTNVPAIDPNTTIIQGRQNKILPSKSTKLTVLIDPNSRLQSRVASQLVASMESSLAVQYEIIFLSANRITVDHQSTCIFLPEIERPFLHKMTSDEYALCQQIVTSANRILWVTNAGDTGSDPRKAMVTGFARCLTRENLGQIFVTLGLENPQTMSSTIGHISRVLRLMITARREDIEPEYKELNGNLWINRVISIEALDHSIALKTGQLSAQATTLGQESSRRLELTIESPGILDTLQFSDVESHEPLPFGYVEIKVEAAGLNFRDVMLALGYSVGESLGFECSGIVTQAGRGTDFQIGDRVVCIVEGALATSVQCEAYAVVRIPDGMTYATAAAFPVAFLTAYYSIVRLARMQQGESILIHSAAGGFGQACIQTARLFDAEIYVTVGNEDKKQLLIDAYGIKGDHIFSSRSPDFGLQIKQLTKERGVDVIVNSLAGEGLKTTWECIAPFGRFLELGKTDISSFAELPMSPFAKGASFIGVDLVQLRKVQDRFHGVLTETMNLVTEGKFTVQTPLNIYKASQLVSAFRYLESGKSVGKSVITLNDDDIVNVVPSHVPSYSFDEESTYVIAGGLGGLGRSIARWMVSRNAKNLILLSRSRTHAIEVQNLLRELREKGVTVATPACDIGNRESLALALASCREMPTIKGCIQAAMVLKENLFMNLSLTDYEAAVRPKVDGSWNLHRLLPTGMDFFVLLSSLSGILGLAGMTGYASGNTYQDALVQHRIAHHEKAVAVDLCNIDNVGYVAEREGLIESLDSLGISVLKESELLALLDRYCDPLLPLPSPLQSQLLVGIQAGHVTSAKRDDPLDRPLFRILRQAAAAANQGGSSSAAAAEPESTVDLTALLSASDTLDEAADVVADGIVMKLSRLLATDRENVDPRRTIATYGVDSLSAVEMRVWFRNVVGAEVSMFDILGGESIGGLSAAVAGRSRFVKAALKGG